LKYQGFFTCSYSELLYSHRQTPLALPAYGTLFYLSLPEDKIIDFILANTTYHASKVYLILNQLEFWAHLISPDPKSAAIFLISTPYSTPKKRKKSLTD
jgi:hypothetical protein